MELFTATGKLKKLQLEMFDVCTTGDTAHIDTIFKLLPHTRQHVEVCVCVCVAKTWISYRCVSCHPWFTHRTSLVVKKKRFQFSCGYEQFHWGKSFGFLVINVCNHREHYETPCINLVLFLVRRASISDEQIFWVLKILRLYWLPYHQEHDLWTCEPICKASWNNEKENWLSQKVNKLLNDNIRRPNVTSLRENKSKTSMKNQQT